MKRLLLIAAMLLCASPAAARIARPPPPPVMVAPIDRAIENVTADESLTEAQREQLLGRLHLIGFAQVDAQVGFSPGGYWYACGAAYDEACASFYPPRETPTRVPYLTDGAFAHLQAARRHYNRALALDPGNLRARLGYAYVLDRLGRGASARQQLRQIIALGTPRLETPVPRQIIDDNAVMNEAVEHLETLSPTRADRRAIARARRSLRPLDDFVPVTPIVVPLTDAPFEALTDDPSPVVFDFAGTGDTRAQGWLTPDAAWLVWDPQQRGDVRSGFDMIGQRTWAVFWSDGFEAMRSLDDNGDGELAGAELGGLALWHDANVNGISEPGEVRPVSERGVVALAVRGEAERPDLLVAHDGVRFANGARRPLYDWTPGVRIAPSS